MLKTLYGKLAFALVVILTVLSAAYLFLTLSTTQLYRLEVTQRLNRDIAAGIVKETVLLKDGAVNSPALDNLFHDLMVINPSIEVYLLDLAGRIIAYNAIPGKVRREAVSLLPIKQFLNGQDGLPIKGDDPRDQNRLKVFSATEIQENGKAFGYLYVVLDGEGYDNVVGMIKNSFILRLAAGIALVCLVASLLIGLLSFSWFTRRLRHLNNAVDRFRGNNLSAAISLNTKQFNGSGDEIDDLAHAVAQMSQHIVTQMEELNRHDTNRRDMVANISHDLRTPLTALSGYIETLMLQGTNLSAAAQKEYLGLALKQSRHLGRLVSELFELARLESTTPELQLETFCFAELVQDITLKFTQQVDQRGLKLSTKFAADLPMVEGDLALVERALSNLLENAIRHTPAGGHIELSLSMDNGRVLACVSDNGRGIAGEHLPHIFERFYHGGGDDQSVGEGSGLGLAIAERITKLHGSELAVASRLGEGSQFSFHLTTA